jgi:hypothetical protein
MDVIELWVAKRWVPKAAASDTPSVHVLALSLGLIVQHLEVVGAQSFIYFVSGKVEECIQGPVLWGYTLGEYDTAK